MSVFFPGLGKFSATVSSNKFSAPFSSPSGTPIIQILVCLMLSLKSLKLASLFFILFFFFCAALIG